MMAKPKKKQKEIGPRSQLAEGAPFWEQDQRDLRFRWRTSDEELRTYLAVMADAADRLCHELLGWLPQSYRRTSDGPFPLFEHTFRTLPMEKKLELAQFISDFAINSAEILPPEEREDLLKAWKARQKREEPIARAPSKTDRPGYLYHTGGEHYRRIEVDQTPLFRRLYNARQYPQFTRTLEQIRNVAEEVGVMYPDEPEWKAKAVTYAKHLAEHLKPRQAELPEGQAVRRLLCDWGGKGEADSMLEKLREVLRSVPVSQGKPRKAQSLSSGEIWADVKEQTLRLMGEQTGRAAPWAKEELDRIIAEAPPKDSETDSKLAAWLLKHWGIRRSDRSLRKRKS